MKFLCALLSLLIMVLAIIYFGWKFAPAPTGPEGSVSAWKELQIKGEGFKLEVASDESSREKGLSRRDSLPPHRGMLFIFGNPDRYGFWMKEMNFPLDIIWLNRGRVVYTVEKAPPAEDLIVAKIYYPTADADSVIEIGSGEVSRLNLKIGDVLSLE